MNIEEAWTADIKEAVLGAFKAIAAHTASADASIYAAAVTTGIFETILRQLAASKQLEVKIDIENIVKTGREQSPHFLELIKDEIQKTAIGSESRVKVTSGTEGQIQIEVQEKDETTKH